MAVEAQRYWYGKVRAPAPAPPAPPAAPAVSPPPTMATAATDVQAIEARIRAGSRLRLTPLY